MYLICQKNGLSAGKRFDGVKLLKYINCYDRVKQYLGDWYLVYGKENKN